MILCEICKLSHDILEDVKNKTTVLKWHSNTVSTLLFYYTKTNRFVLCPRKISNRFVLKNRPGGFADYTKGRKEFPKK